MRFIFFIYTSLFFCSAAAQPKTDSFLQKILSGNQDPALARVLEDPATYRLQIIYTRIDRDKHNQPSFQNFYFNVDPNLYWNPASTVKLPLALLSLEKLNQLRDKGINKYTAMQFDSLYPGQAVEYQDSTSKNQLPSIAHFIKKALLVSDNDAYNRLYEFLGQQTINRNLHDKGYSDIRITRQFKGFTEDQNRHTNPIRFIDGNGKLIWEQPMGYNTDSFYFPQEIKLGKAHFNRDDSLVDGPFDFTRHNNLSIEDLQQLLQSALFPLSVPSKQRFTFGTGDKEFLYQYLSQFPSETNYPFYDTSKFYDSYVKFYFKYGDRHLPPHLRVFNKVGWAYGFLTDVSYVADFSNKIEFMLSTTLYVNSDGILNDNNYDYDSIGYPFMYQLGQTIYQYELKRSRPYKPDLRKFMLEYEHRDPADKRSQISEVDN